MWQRTLQPSAGSWPLISSSCPSATSFRWTTTPRPRVIHTGASIPWRGFRMRRRSRHRLARDHCGRSRLELNRKPRQSRPQRAGTGASRHTNITARRRRHRRPADTSACRTMGNPAGVDLGLNPASGIARPPPGCSTLRSFKQHAAWDHAEPCESQLVADAHNRLCPAPAPR